MQTLVLSDWFLVTLIVLFSFLGAIPLIIFYRYAKESKSSKTWPSVVGEIITSEVESSDDTEDTTFQAKIVYGYDVNDLPYQSSRMKIGIQWAMGRGEKSDIESFLNKYPKNQPVQIFYNPNDPRRSILEKSIDSSALALIYLSLIILLFPVLLFLDDFFSNIDLGLLKILFNPLFIIPYAIILGIFWFKLNIWKRIGRIFGLL